MFIASHIVYVCHYGHIFVTIILIVSCHMISHIYVMDIISIVLYLSKKEMHTCFRTIIPSPVGQSFLVDNYTPWLVSMSACCLEGVFF